MESTLLLMASCNHGKQAESAAENVGTKVEVSEVKSVKAIGNLHYSGTIEPSQTIPLNFQTSGVVEKVLVEAGDAVKKGQLLAVLDKVDLQNVYDVSYAKYQQAKDAYDRLKVVYDKGSLTEIKWVEMETNLKQAESSVNIAKNNLDKSNLRAPDNAIVGRRNIEPGMSSISVTSPIELVKIENVFVKISVPENEIGLLKKGIKASFSVSALNNKQYEGFITNVSPVADAFSRTYEAKILVKNEGLELKPGMVCDVSLDLKSETKQVLIAYQSISKDNEGKTFVYLADTVQKRVKKQIVKLGNYNGSNIEILMGLTEGQIIVSKGKEKLSDNALIRL